MTEDEVLQARGKKGLKRHRKERKDRGWSVYDAWSADGHLLRMIGEVARYYRKHSAGYPAGMEEDEWNVVLDRIAEPLIDYANRQFDVPMDDALFDRAAEALHLFAEWHGHFWN